MAAIDTITKRRMLKRIRAEITLAEAKASSLRAGPDLRAYAYLFDNAVRFWGDVAYIVSNDSPEPISPE